MDTNTEKSEKLSFYETEKNRFSFSKRKILLCSRYANTSGEFYSRMLLFFNSSTS